MTTKAMETKASRKHCIADYTRVRLAVGLVALCFIILASAGCGSTNTLPDQPTAQEIADTAVRWIEAEDTTAWGERGPEWYYQNGGKEARGWTGGILTRGDTYYHNVDGYLTDSATWVKVSPADFSVENATDRVRTRAVSLGAVYMLTSNPLLVLKHATFGPEITASEDGTLLIVRGTAPCADIWREFLGEEGARALAADWSLPDIEVELSVSMEDGHPVSAVLPLLPGPEPWTCRWYRTNWNPGDDAILTFDEYMETAEVAEPHVTTTATQPLPPTPESTVTTVAAPGK